MTVGSLARIASLAVGCALLGGCGGMTETGLSPSDLAYSHPPQRAVADAYPSGDPNSFPDSGNASDGDSAPAAVDGPRLQCVPYARAHSNVSIFGDAYTWWDKAAGVYARGSSPVLGSVIVLNGYARHRAHVAVVRSIVSAREIRIDHANWLDHGAIYVNDPVMDVSDDNDWSQVKVWNIATGSWGTRTYRVQGFIGPGPDGNPVVASNEPPRHDDPIARQSTATNPDSDDSGDDR